MATCEIHNQRSQTSCAQPATYVVDTMVNGQLKTMLCCGRHKARAVDTLVDADPYASNGGARPFGAYHTVHFQRTTWRLRTQVINTHVRVVCLKSSEEASVVSRGTVEFGPMSRQEYLDALYDECFEERCRIGMFGLQEERREQYDELTQRMRDIEEPRGVF